MEQDDDSSRHRRRRVLADRLGDLPDGLLHEVLSHLGSRQAVQTSVLSRRWRHLWRDVPCLDLDQREFHHLDQWARFEAFADHYMLLRPAAQTPPLDTFRLHLTDRQSSTPDSWIRRGLERRRDHKRTPPLDAFGLHLTDSQSSAFDSWIHSQSGTLDSWIRRGLERLPLAVDIRACLASFTTWPVTDAVAGSRLTRLRLLQVVLPSGFGPRIGEQCPVIEELHLENCRRTWDLRDITSLTLRSLAVIRHHYSFSAGELVLAAPRLASLHLDIRNDGTAVVVVDLERAASHGGEALGSLAAASIRVETTTYPDNEWVQQRKRNFWSSIHSLLRRAPNLTNLQLQGFTTTAFLDKQSPELLPVFHRLKTLLLHKCDVIGADFEFEALTTILDNTPNLDKLELHHCMLHELQLQQLSATPPSSSSSIKCHTLTQLVCKKKKKILKSVEIKGGDELHLRHFFIANFIFEAP